jgi:hypothetical protein
MRCGAGPGGDGGSGPIIGDRVSDKNRRAQISTNPKRAFEDWRACALTVLADVSRDFYDNSQVKLVLYCIYQLERRTLSEPLVNK